jgi:DNA-binding response OmpR family regulator
MTAANPIEERLRQVPRPRVLVMDDEDGVLRAICRKLECLGFDAEAASEGSQVLSAFSRARAEGRSFSAVILDLRVNGGLGGAATLAALKNIDPSVRAGA